MKKILYSLLSIGVISTIVIFASNAFFSDTETSTGNILKAGKVDLLVDSSCSYNGQASSECGTWDSKNLTSEKFFHFSDVKPGDYGENTISLKVEDNPSWLCMAITPTANDDVSSNEPELKETGEILNNPSDLWDGELKQNLKFHIWADVCEIPPAVVGDNIFQDGCDKNITETLSDDPVTIALADSAKNVFTGNAGPINGNHKYYLGFGWSLPDTVGNITQTDSFAADISFQAEQSRNNKDFVCPQQENIFFDDFNDGNADGWDLNQTLGQAANIGNWKVEDGKLVQSTGFDGVLALLPSQYSDQTDETLLKIHGPSGGAGFAIWFKDKTNSVFVMLSNGTLGVAEVSNNVWTNYDFPVAFNINDDKWVNLKIDANSVSGEIKVYLDGVYMFTYNATTPVRVGQSGLMHGNAGGTHDYFKLTSN